MPRIMSTLRRTSGIVPEMSVSGIPETAISGIYQKRYLTFLAYTRIAGEYSGNVHFSYSTRDVRFWYTRNGRFWNIPETLFNVSGIY